MRRKAVLVGTLLTVGAGLLVVTWGRAQPSLRVRVDRWLEVKQVNNSVTLEQGAERRAARVGDRLQTVGDTITTGQKSTATLAVDTGIGIVEIAEQTTLRVRLLDTTPGNGHITYLEVPTGRARLKLRRFTNPDSKLELQTPAGLSGVRGTDFGVSVQPNGKTGLAVLQGGVRSTAQGRGVDVAGNFQNFTIPGETPSAAVKLKNDTRLQYNFEKTIAQGVRQVRLLGQVDPVNLVMVDGIAQVTDRNGRFKADLHYMPSYLKIQVIVTTPLGKQKTYELALQ